VLFLARKRDSSSFSH